MSYFDEYRVKFYANTNGSKVLVADKPLEEVEDDFFKRNYWSKQDKDKYHEIFRQVREQLPHGEEVYVAELDLHIFHINVTKGLNQ